MVIETNLTTKINLKFMATISSTPKAKVISPATVLTGKESRAVSRTRPSKNHPQTETIANQAAPSAGQESLPTGAPPAINPYYEKAKKNIGVISGTTNLATTKR